MELYSRQLLASHPAARNGGVCPGAIGDTAVSSRAGDGRTPSKMSIGPSLRLVSEASMVRQHQEPA